MGLLSTIGAASGRAFGLTRVGVLKDLYFNLVTLLLPGNGTNGAQNNTFLDSSTNNFTITRNGNTTQGTFSPFSQTGWSNYFDGTGDYLSLTISSTTIGSGDFTIEFWYYPTAFQNFDSMFSTTRGANGFNIGTNASASVVWYSSSAEQINSGTLTQNAWNHIAFTRTSNTLRLYVNGSQTGATPTVSTNFSATSCWIGDLATSGSEPSQGYISNLRVVTQSLASGSTYTVSTTPLTAIANTSLLTCQSNRFIDNSSNAFAITRNGDVSVQAFSPFAPTAAYSAATVGGSGYFDGTGDSLASTTDFESSTSTSTFTIEGWVYPTTFSTLINVIGGMVVSSGDQKSIAAEVNTSGQVALYWFDGSIKRCTGNTAMQLNAWNYFAIVVSSNAISIYVNKTTADTLSGTTTLTNRTQLTDLGVGAYYNNNAPAQYFNGYLSSIRVSTVARTISAVPTAPFESDANVRWLLNFTNAGITDATAKNDLETVGNAQISTTQSKFGGSSMYFDGTGDYLTFPANPLYAFGTGDFTIEAWVYPTSNAAVLNICGTRTNAGTVNGWNWGILTNGSSQMYSNSAIANTGASTVPLNTWTHLAFVRTGGTIYGYVNGVQKGSTANTENFTINTFWVGITGGTAEPFFGYIDDLRITRFARYTSNFTPPTAALPLQ